MKWLRRLGILSVVLIALGLVGYFALCRWLKGELTDRAAATLGAEVVIDDLGLGLLSSSVELTGLSVKRAADRAGLIPDLSLTARRAEVQLDPGALFRGEAKTRAVYLEGPTLSASLERPGLLPAMA